MEKNDNLKSVIKLVFAILLVYVVGQILLILS